MSTIESIKQAIMADPQNKEYTEKGIEPLFAAPKTARINIIGQAPGMKTEEAGIYWKDKSGDRLREWLGVDEDTFYHSGLFAVIPMDFYFPGHGKSGDLPLAIKSGWLKILGLRQKWSQNCKHWFKRSFKNKGERRWILINKLKKN